MNRAIISKKVLLEVGFNNDHVGSDMGGLGQFGVFGIVQVNDAGVRIMSWAVNEGLHLVNTYFEKKVTV